MELKMVGEGLGYLAATLVFIAFYMRTMVPLRIIAIASNLAFFGYGLGFGLWPVAVLHGLLLPLNTLRLVQIRRMLGVIAAARDAKINVHALAHHFTLVEYPRGAVIFRKNDRGDSAYFIASGTVDFPELGVHCGRGDLFGEIAIFSPDHTRTASAICTTNVELYRIDDQAILTSLYQEPALAFALLQLVTHRLLLNCASLEAELSRLKRACQVPPEAPVAAPSFKYHPAKPG